MQNTVKKQHYKFTLYHLETYFFTDYKTKYWGSDEVYYKEKTWVNQSNYKEVFSLNFTDEKKLKVFLRDRYKDDYTAYFYTKLGYAIKSCTVYNAMEWIAIISSSESEALGYPRRGFKLRNRKKENKYPQRRKSRYHDYYKSGYAWLGREIKRKHAEKFFKEINDVY